MWGAVAAWVLIILTLLLASCTKTVYVPVETVTVRTDTDSLARLVTRLVETNSSRSERETLYVFRDREVTLNENGDTVREKTSTFTDRSRELETENRLLRQENDSLRHAKSRTDSVYVEKPVPVEVVKEVERKRGWWETALLWAGGIALMTLGFLLIWRFKS